MHIRPKNWATFQHYRDRKPPWIKLHRELLDDFEFQSLPVASKALAPMLWLLASEDAAGLVDADHQKLAFRLRLTATEVAEALKPLIASRFFVVVRGASGVLAETERDARPERETEGEAQVQAEVEDSSAAADQPVPCFAEFWLAYPTDRNMSRKLAEQRWNKLTPEKRRAALAAIPGFRSYCAANSWYRPLHAERFLSQERFEGYAAEANLKPIADELAGRAWNGEAAKLIDALGEKGAALFSSWFSGANFEPGPPRRIILPNAGRRAQVEMKFSGPLRKAFGDEVILEVAS